MEDGRRKLTGVMRKKRAPDSPRGGPQPQKRLKVKVKPSGGQGPESQERSGPATPGSATSPTPGQGKRALKAATAGFKRKVPGKAKKMVGRWGRGE